MVTLRTAGGKQQVAESVPPWVALGSKYPKMVKIFLILFSLVPTKTQHLFR
jgi:hypothetical protein